MSRHISSTSIEMDLRTSEERWQSLLDNPIFGVTFLDEHQRFVTTSRTFQNMVGYSDEELRLLTPLDISVSGEREINANFFSEMREGKRRHYEMIKQLRCKNGKLIWVHLYVFAITNRKSGAQLPFGIVFDITERKQAEDALQETRTQLARVARVNQMVAMTGSIAHEINQPISAILANANAGLRWLERTTPDLNETRAVLKAIVREAKRTDTIINGIRTIFKAGVLQVVLPLFNLGSAAVALGICRAAVTGTATHLKSARFEHLGQSLGESLPTLRAQIATMQIDTDGLAARIDDLIDHLERPRETTVLRVLETKAAAGEVAIAVTSAAMRICGAARRSQSTWPSNDCSATPMPAP